MQAPEPVPTLQAWLAPVPGFAWAVRHGRTLADADVVDRVHQNALGFICEVGRPARAENVPVRVLRRRPPNRLARRFWLANRRACRKAGVEAAPRRETARWRTDAELSRLTTEFAAQGSASDG